MKNQHLHIMGPVEHIKKFVFATKPSNTSAEPEEKVEILIPELLISGYSFYTWPCAPILAWFLWDRRHVIASKRILELGAGTSLPGILAAKCGAQVILSDNSTLPRTLTHIERCCNLNKLVPGKDIEVIGISWGVLLSNITNLNPIDLIISSDCFYDPSVFEDILVTVSYLLEQNPSARFIFTYQERSTDWTLEALLEKWELRARHINLDPVGQSSGVDLTDLMLDHTIHLIEVTLK